MRIGISVDVAGKTSAIACHSCGFAVGLQMNHLCQLSVVQAAKAIREGEITSESLVAALLERAREMESLNAFVACDGKQLASAARVADMQRNGGRALGPLHGVPIALKDNINTIRL